MTKSPENREILEKLPGLTKAPVEQEREQQPSATQIAHDIMTGVATDDEGVRQEQSVISGSIKDSESRAQSKLPAKVIKSILELLCDESGFLVESKLNKLLAPLDKDERSLMKLDAIFAALGVDTEEDIYVLAQHFLKPDSETTGETTEQQTAEPDKPVDEIKIIEDEKPENQDKQDIDGDDVMSEKSSVSTRKADPVALIHPNDVVSALRKFVEIHRQPQKDSKKQSVKVDSTSSKTVGVDPQFWHKMVSVIDEKKERLWDGLLLGCDKYLTVLTERAGLIQETDALRQQNAELRMLLHQYVNSRVNQELEIPPTKILQAELSKEAN